MIFNFRVFDREQAFVTSSSGVKPMKDTSPFTWILRRAESPERKSPRHHPLQSRDARPPRPTFNINEVKIDYSLVVQPCHDKPVTCLRLSNTVRLRKTLLRI